MRQTFNLKFSTWHLRRELRLALLAAAETCWVYAVIVLLTALVVQPQPLTPLPFFAAYWLALILGRALPKSKASWIVLQIIAVAIAGLAVLVVARAELYSQLDWLDLSWLPDLIATLLSLTHNIAAAHMVSLGVVYVFVRGLSLAQRPLTLWFIGFQFRLGIVIFFGALLAAAAIPAMSKSTNNLTPWIFVYFALSLIAIALARIEEMASDVRYGPRWFITLLASVALVIFIGLGALQVVTLDALGIIFVLLTPVWAIFSAIIFLLAIPLGIIAGWLIEWLTPFATSLGILRNQFAKLVPENLTSAENLQSAIAALIWLEPVLKTATVLLIVFALGYWIARALNRRMQQIEEATFIRESIGNDDNQTDSAQRKRFSKRKPHPRAQHIAAESIRRIYAALVARAGDAGLPRDAAETPYEFLPRLQEHWQTHADDLRAITDAYVNVHYAEHDAAPTQVERVRAAWNRAQKVIRRD